MDGSRLRRGLARPRFWRGLAVSALVVAGWPLVWCWWIAGALARPSWYVYPGPGRPLSASAQHDPRTDFGVAYEDVVFETVGAAHLRGWLVPGDDPGARDAVLLAGGAWSDRRTFHGQIPLFAHAGIPALYFDWREHGQSDGAGRGSSLGVREHEDVSAGVRFLEDARGFDAVAVVGYSVGAVAALWAAAEDPRIDAVAALNGGIDARAMLARHPQLGDTAGWLEPLVERIFLLREGAALRMLWHGVPDPRDFAARVAPRPLLVMQSASDEYVTLDEGRRLFAAAHEPKALWIEARANHAGLLDAPSPELEARLVAFLRESLAAARQGRR